jgi:predicted phosphodiesterase
MRANAPLARFLTAIAAVSLVIMGACTGVPKERNDAPSPVPEAVLAPPAPKQARSSLVQDQEEAQSPAPANKAAAAEAGGKPEKKTDHIAVQEREKTAPLILAFSSDPHYGSARADVEERRRILVSVSASRASAFYLAGDITDFGTRSQWLDAASSIAAGLRGPAFASVMGNHDAYGNGKRWWNEYLNRDPSAANGYFEHRWPGVRVIGLDFVSGLSSWTERQEAWFKERLADTRPGETVIVVSHMYFYSSGIEGWHDDPKTIARLCPLFVRYGVDLVVSGHNHYMELLEADGVKYAVVGAAGAAFDPPPTFVSPKSKWFLRGRRGWLEVEAGKAGARPVMRFRGVDGEILLESEL